MGRTGISCLDHSDLTLEDQVPGIALVAFLEEVGSAVKLHSVEDVDDGTDFLGSAAHEVLGSRQECCESSSRDGHG